MFIKILWALTILIMSSSLVTASEVRVTLLKGDVTKLIPGSTKAVTVKKGDILPEDTSIVTNKKSFIRITFSNKSNLTLGPESKIIISKAPDIEKPSMVNLLTGQIKAEVDKKENKENRNKMIVKTRSAVMGIRGTKFQVVYNSTNNNTGLVTIEGKVAIMRGKDETVDSETAIKKLDQELRSSEHVLEVQAGKYSGVQNIKDKPTHPVKIAPKQYNAIAKAMGSKKIAKDVMSNKDSASLIDAPRPGGFIDFDTAIYVPPLKDSNLDKTTGTYAADDMGDVDSDGDYIPPKGLGLDAKKGFVIYRDRMAMMSAAEQKKLKQTAIKIQKINSEVKEQVKELPEKTKTNVRPNKPFLEGSAKVNFISESLIFDTGSKEDEFYTESAYEAVFEVKQNWSEKLSSFLKVGSLNSTFEGEFKRNNSSSGNLYEVGANYKISDPLTIGASIFNKVHYFAYTTALTGSEVFSKDLTGLRLTGNYELLSKEKFSIGAQLGAKIFNEADVAIAGINGKMTGMGLSGALNGQYKLTPKMSIIGSAFGGSTSHSLDEVKEGMKFERSTMGLSVGFSLTP